MPPEKRKPSPSRSMYAAEMGADVRSLMGELGSITYVFDPLS